MNTATLSIASRPLTRAGTPPDFARPMSFTAPLGQGSPTAGNPVAKRAKEGADNNRQP